MKVNGKQVKSFDLEARQTCPGSKVNGEVVEVCKQCYATKGSFTWPASVALRKHNQQDYHRDEWVDDMVKLIGNDKYFRAFSSGDFESTELILKFTALAHRCPSTAFWCPTRSDQLSSMQPYLSVLASLPNVTMRPSANFIGFKRERPGVNSYVIRPSDIPEAATLGVKVCPVTLPGSTQKSCNTCTTCYTDAKVAYVIH